MRLRQVTGSRMSNNKAAAQTMTSTAITQEAAQRVASSLLHQLLTELQQVTILDPACGSAA